MKQIKDFFKIGGGPNIIFWPGDATSDPDGYLFCNGASLLRADYPDLFALIGTTYGAVDGDHFNLPDYRGRFFRCVDSGAVIDTNAGGRVRADGTTGDVPGSMQASYQPSHTHVMSGRTNTGWATSWKPPSVATTSADAGHTGEARQQNIALRVLIRI